MQKLFFGMLFVTIQLNVYSQEKWKVTAMKGITKGMGRLNLVFPDSVIWSVDIYSSANKFLDNHSIMDRRNADDTKNYYELTPGIYNFKLNTVMVENVPIEEGKETRLKAGVLEITTAGNWELRNETKEKFLTSGNQPKKFALPVGNYQLKEGGGFRMVQIVDEIRDPGDVPDNFIVVGDKYVMTPIESSTSEKFQKTEGRLIMKYNALPIGNNSSYTEPIYMAITKSGETETIYECNSNCPATYTLPVGNYDIRFGIHPIKDDSDLLILQNIPILKEYETRLKIGFLRAVNASGTSRISEDSPNSRHLLFYNNGSWVPIPVGNYVLAFDYLGRYSLAIIDSQQYVLQPLDSLSVPNPRYDISDILNKPSTLKLKYGRLNTTFPNAENAYIGIEIPNAYGYNSIKLNDLKYYDAPPGPYRVLLLKKNTLPPVDIVIQAGKETRLKAGYLYARISEGDVSAQAWKLYGIKNYLPDLYIACFSGMGRHTLVLPVGFYALFINTRYYYLYIKDGETLTFREFRK